MQITDLSAERRWLRYRRMALEQTPIRSILSFELFIDGGSMAALNFYADHPHAFSEESVEIGTVFATHIALGWSMMRRNDQFRSALASRDIIGQAKGSSWSASVSTPLRRSSCSPGSRNNPTSS